MANISKPPQSTFVSYSNGDLYPPALHEVDEDPLHTDGNSVFEQPITDYCIHDEINLP